MTCDAWPVDLTKLPALPDENTQPDEYAVALDERNDAIEFAQDILWALSGRQFGVCLTEVRPHASGFPGRYDYGRSFPYRPNLSGVIIDNFGSIMGCGCTGGGCRLSGPGMVHLPGPVAKPTVERPIIVKFGLGDGNVRILGEDEFRLEGDVLYRSPCCSDGWPFQDYSQPVGCHSTWSVRYRRGLVPPNYVGKFVALLAKELIASWNDGPCKLPASVRRITRQGVSMELDPTAIVALGYTGLREVDRWLATVNPRHLMQAPSVI